MNGHINSSGFPLQMAVKNHVDETSRDHGWRCRYAEHSWKNEITGDSGFIDLVFQNKYGTQFLVVECKRVKDTAWIFLVDEKEGNPRRHAKCFVFNKGGAEVKRFEWLDLTLDPSSPQSKFCVVPGTDGRSQSLIERVSAELVAATESLAFEDKSLSLNDRDDLRVYFNVIVTTAKLHVCRFDSATISLDDGTIPPDKASYEEVPYVRFRKQLNPVFKIPEVFRVFGDVEVERAKENTIFIVNSNYISKFISEFEIDRGGTNSVYLR